MNVGRGSNTIKIQEGSGQALTCQRYNWFLCRLNEKYSFILKEPTQLNEDALLLPHHYCDRIFDCIVFLFNPDKPTSLRAGGRSNQGHYGYFGIMYRIRLTNVGSNSLNGVVVDLGATDVQNLTSLDPGQSYFFYPKPETQVKTVKVSTNEGIAIESDFRSPTKVLGLPGAGR